jgi:hypothetical protein
LEFNVIFHGLPTFGDRHIQGNDGTELAGGGSDRSRRASSSAIVSAHNFAVGALAIF